MKSFILTLVGLLALSACVIPQADEIVVLSKVPANIPGYVNMTYVVRCPGTNNELDVIPVSYFGPDFDVKNPEVLRSEFRKSCRAAAIGDDSPGPEASSDSGSDNDSGGR